MTILTFLTRSVKLCLFGEAIAAALPSPYTLGDAARTIVILIIKVNKIDLLSIKMMMAMINDDVNDNVITMKSHSGSKRKSAFGA